MPVPPCAEPALLACPSWLAHPQACTLPSQQSSVATTTVSACGQDEQLLGIQVVAMAAAALANAHSSSSSSSHSVA